MDTKSQKTRMTNPKLSPVSPRKREKSKRKEKKRKEKKRKEKKRKERGTRIQILLMMTPESSVHSVKLMMGHTGPIIHKIATGSRPRKSLRVIVNPMVIRKKFPTLLRN